MQLEGSCHCKSVRFSVAAHTPYPYMRCYCSVCRKTAGGGGYAINIGADADTLDVTGKRALRVYQIRLEDGTESPAQRNFCGKCGSALWVFDPRWPELVHPFASAIDTELPATLERAHIMTEFAPKWIYIPGGKRNPHFAGYPDQSLEEWHRSRGLYDEG